MQNYASPQVHLSSWWIVHMGVRVHYCQDKDSEVGSVHYSRLIKTEEEEEL